MSADFSWNHEVSDPDKHLEAALRMIQMESHIANTPGTTDVWRQKFLRSIETRCDAALDKLKAAE
jgi:hypothetical protein